MPRQTEAVIDPTQDTLDLDIFEREGDSWLLRSDVQDALLQLSAAYSDFGDIAGVYLVGSILSFQWIPTSDIDLHLIMDLDEETLDAARDLSREGNRRGDMLLDTRHPIQTYIEPTSEFSHDKYTGILNLETGEWIKGPYDIAANVEDYLDAFRDQISKIDLSRAELVRDLIDYNFLMELSLSDRSELASQAGAKIREIDYDVHELVSTRDELRQFRSAALRGELDPAEIEKYGHKQLLPGAVIWKLGERYAYYGLLNELKGILKQADDEIKNAEEVDDVEQAVRNNPLLPDKKTERISRKYYIGAGDWKERATEVFEKYVPDYAGESIESFVKHIERVYGRHTKLTGKGRDLDRQLDTFSEKSRDEFDSMLFDLGVSNGLWDTEGDYIGESEMSRKIDKVIDRMLAEREEAEQEAPQEDWIYLRLAEKPELLDMVNTITKAVDHDLMDAASLFLRVLENTNASDESVRRLADYIGKVFWEYKRQEDRESGGME